MELYGSLITNEGGGGGGGDTTDVPIKSVSVNGIGVVPVNKNVDITVPTKTSDLENDSDFIDKGSIATTLSSDLTNDEVASAKLVYDELQKLDSENKEQFSTVIGDYITVNDSVDGNIVELGIGGSSIQNTYSGRNLVPYPYEETTKTSKGITFTDNGDGSLSINGTATDTAYFNFKYKTLSLLDKEYTLSCDGIKTNVKLYVYDETGGVDYEVTYSENTITFTADSTHTYSLSALVISGATIDNVKIKPMIVEGTEVIPYEPYVGGTPSPNPSYPQPINSVGDDGSIVVKSRGRNLIPYPYYNGADTRNDITATINSNDNSINLKGTATDKYFFVLLHKDYNGKGFAKQFRGKTVTISGGKSAPVLSLAVYDEEGNNITPPNNKMLYDYGGSVTITVPENAYDMYFYYYCSSGTVLNTTLKPQLEVGEVATEYEPYRGSNITIPLSEPLRSVEDIKDEITYQDGKWGVLRWVKRLSLDTPLFVSKTDDFVYDMMARFDSLYDSFNYVNNKSDIKKCRFEKFESQIIYQTDLCGAYISWSGTVNARLSSSICGDSEEEALVYFKNNPLVVEYVLATPVFEPFKDQTLPYQLATYNGVTNIFSDDALSTEMTVKYPTTDTSGVVSKTEAKIIELENSKVDKCSIPDVPYTLADIYSTDITGGSVAYTIKNGICSIAITVLDTVKNGDLLVTETTFPNPILDGALYPVIETETGQVIGNAYVDLGKLHVELTANASMAYATLVYIVKE